MDTSNNWSITTSKHFENLYLHNNDSFSDEFHMIYEERLRNVRITLRNVEDPSDSLKMVDAIQRLGIDYRFQEEIEGILQKQYVTANSLDYNTLHDVSLSFRLLRDKGFNIPADVFNNFRGKNGNFEERLAKDMKGLLSLYEASHLSMGEYILDDAQSFSSNLLNEWVMHLNYHQAKVVQNSLRHPYHKTLQTFMGNTAFLEQIYGKNRWLNSMQELAKLDFNMLQSIHQKELLEISMWWKELGLANELKLARNQPIKWYAWPMTILTEPHLSQQRIELTKTISFIYIIDDIFDVYGTIDELTLFTEAVYKWDSAAIEELPDYMKPCFKALYEITSQIGYKVCKEFGWNPINSLKETWVNLCNAFLVEAKWFASGHLPSADEYLQNGIVSCGVPVVLVHTLFLLGHGTNIEDENLVDSTSGIISSVATILRLWDDLGSAKDENQDGHDGSYIDCYMKENRGASVETVRKRVMDMISDSWKTLNRECLCPKLSLSSFKRASLNSARMVPLMYSYDDSQCLPVLEDYIKSMLYDKVSLDGIICTRAIS